jgi:hypothetical protein
VATFIKTYISRFTRAYVEILKRAVNCKFWGKTTAVKIINDQRTTIKIISYDGIMKDKIGRTPSVT